MPTDPCPICEGCLYMLKSLGAENQRLKAALRAAGVELPQAPSEPEEEPRDPRDPHVRH